MKYLIILLCIFTSCKFENEVNKRKCVIKEIEVNVGSTIDSSPKFKLITDCGVIIKRDDKYRVGDTIIIHEIKIFEK